MLRMTARAAHAIGGGSDIVQAARAAAGIMVGQRRRRRGRVPGSAFVDPAQAREQALGRVLACV